MAGPFGCRPHALACAGGLALIVAAGVPTASAQTSVPAGSASPAPAAPATGEAPAPAPPATAPSTAVGGQDGSPPPTAGGAAAGSAAKGAVTGYGYRSSAAPGFDPRPRRHLLAHHANEAVATFTGFEMLADGGSRLFVQLSRTVDVAQATGEKPRPGGAAAPKKGKRAHSAGAGVVSSLKFVLKGAEVVNPNNERALVTVHFNTPVVRARLAPAGRDLALLIDLRAEVAPQMKIVPAKDNGAMLQIDFAPGTYLPSGAVDPGDDAPGPPATSTPNALPSSAGSK